MNYKLGTWLILTLVIVSVLQVSCTVHHLAVGYKSKHQPLLPIGWNKGNR